MKRTPIIFVHDTGQDLHPYYLDIVRAGGLVRRVPNYKVSANREVYYPRNTPGTLKHAAELGYSQSDFFVLCDPDMVFLRQPRFPNMLSGDYYSYLDYSQSFVHEAGRRMGIRHSELLARHEELCCGVPHVIPVPQAALLAETWLEAIDALIPRRWLDSMYAFGLAALKLKLKLIRTNMVAQNDNSLDKATREIIHYCTGDELWNKRRFLTDFETPNLWDLEMNLPSGTILWAIMRQIRAAKKFYTSQWT